MDGSNERNIIVQLLLTSPPPLYPSRFAAIMAAVCRGEVCKYAQQSKNRALKLSRLDLAGLHRSQTVGMAHFSKPSSLEYACYRQTAKKKYFSRHSLPYPRERTFLPWMSCRGWMVQVYPPPPPPLLERAHICAATHQTQTFPVTLLPSSRAGGRVYFWMWFVVAFRRRVSLTAKETTTVVKVECIVPPRGGKPREPR